MTPPVRSGTKEICPCGRHAADGRRRQNEMSRVRDRNDEEDGNGVGVPESPVRPVPEETGKAVGQTVRAARTPGERARRQTSG